MYDHRTQEDEITPEVYEAIDKLRPMFRQWYRERFGEDAFQRTQSRTPFISAPPLQF